MTRLGVEDERVARAARLQPAVSACQHGCSSTGSAALRWRLILSDIDAGPIRDRGPAPGGHLGLWTDSGLAGVPRTASDMRRGPPLAGRASQAAEAARCRYSDVNGSGWGGTSPSMM